MLQNPAWATAAAWRGGDAKDDPDTLVVDLDPPHESANDVAFHGPICLVQAILNHRREGLELADDEVQGASLLGLVLEHRGFAFQLGDPLPQARDPRLELRFADHRLGIAVDQPTDTVP